IGPGLVGPAVQGGGEIRPLPFVSVVMPVRNEAGFIERSLGSVLTQDYSPDRMEVIIADGMSGDGTREMVLRLAASDARVTLVDNPGRIAPTALNVAITRSRGDVVIRVDGHCEIAPDYVSRCVHHLASGETAGVGGPLETVGQTRVAQVIAIAMSSGFGVGGAAFRTRKMWTGFVDTVAFPAYTRAALRLAGPYDEELVRNQDDEYNYRLRERGGRILLAADVRVRYYGRASVSSLFRQYFQYGLWKVRVLQKHPRQMRLRQFVPPVFVACLLAGAFAAPFAPWARHGLLGVGVAYAVANLVASFFSGRVGPFPEVLLLPIVFATLHVSYGVGFLTGLVRFRNRWSETTIGSPPAGRHEGSA
ncbi:MAG TPA: glycosyltransferase family 2 protein, partial [Thermoanaerobaculia bacterium]